MPGVEEHQPDFRGALRSIILVGGGSVVTMLIGLVRTKCIAALLGPSGIALAAILTQIFEVGGAATGLGLGASGVRQIASAQASGDGRRFAQVVKTLRRTVWCTGTSALLVMIACAGWISEFTFGTTAYRIPIMLLGGVVFIRALMTSQTCILQGSRRVADAVKSSIAGAVAALITYVPFAYYLGEAGIAPGILCATLINFCVSWWYARKVPIEETEYSWEDGRREVSKLLTFGFPMMLTTLVGTFTPYFERVILLKTIGLNELGQYQAAYALTGVAVGFILSAMTADFYPKLMAHVDNHERMNKEVNAQIEISLIFAMSAAVWMAACAPLMISLLYTKEFTPAAAVLTITVLGIVGRVIGWPLRLVLMAQGRSALLFIIEVGFAALGLLAVWLMSVHYSTLGAAYAFVGTHLLYALVMVVAAPSLLNIKVSLPNIRTALIMLLLVSLLVINGMYNPYDKFRWILGISTAITVSIVNLVYLSRHTGWKLPKMIRNRKKADFEGGPPSL